MVLCKSVFEPRIFLFLQLTETKPWRTNLALFFCLLERMFVINFPSAAVSAATFGERPRQAADAAHLLLLAGSQRRCSVDRAAHSKCAYAA